MHQKSFGIPMSIDPFVDERMSNLVACGNYNSYYAGMRLKFNYPQPNTNACAPFGRFIGVAPCYGRVRGLWGWCCSINGYYLH